MFSGAGVGAGWAALGTATDSAQTAPRRANNRKNAVRIVTTTDLECIPCPQAKEGVRIIVDPAVGVASLMPTLCVKPDPWAHCQCRAGAQPGEPVMGQD